MYSQRRYRHFLQAAKRQTWPTCIVAVEAFSENTQASNVARACDANLRCWTAETATFSNGILQRKWQHSGDTVADWWNCLEHNLRYHQNLWVVSWHASRIAGLLGLWEEMECKRSYLVGSDTRSNPDSSSEGSHSFQGYCVLQNPPTIISFKRQHFPGTVTWTDMRNFGYSKSTELGKGHTLPQQMLGTLADIMSFLREKNLGSVRPTTGSQSLYSWKFRFLKHSIHVSTNETQNNLGQAALFGGRNECFRLGEIQGPITQFDINSLYPSVYCRYPLPLRCRYVRCNPSDSDIATAIRGKNCIARVLVQTDVANVPKRDGRGTYFPIGRISTVVAYPELEVILDTCRLCRITELATFDLDFAFREYGQALYACRLEANSRGDRHIARYIKSCLVSLPGKFGQRQKRWRISSNQSCPEPWSTWVRQNKQGGIVRCRSLGWTVEEEFESGLSPEAVPEISAWVNSWGRRILLELMQNACKQNVYYSDTDSIWTNAQGSDKIRAIQGWDTSGLGEIREVNTYASVQFNGLKHYIADGTTTCAGDGQVYDCFGRYICTRKSNSVVKPYLHGSVQSDLTVKPLICEDF
jgi:hypothetical protein